MWSKVSQILILAGFPAGLSVKRTYLGFWTVGQSKHDIFKSHTGLGSLDGHVWLFPEILWAEPFNKKMYRYILNKNSCNLN